MIQRTDDWYAARIGKVTASRIDDVMARIKSGYSASRKNYMAEKVVEIFTGKPFESYSNTSMQWGIDNEDAAKLEYSLRTFEDIEEVGFIDHPTIRGSGSSPDGLIGNKGLIEIKCPNTATHIETLLSHNVDGKYIKQIQFQLACTNREWCDYVSYDPRLTNEKLQIYIKRIDRDNEMIAEIENEVVKFINELNETVKKLQEVAA